MKNKLHDNSKFNLLVNHHDPLHYTIRNVNYKLDEIVMKMKT